jgi:hypothetical protein
MIYFRKGEIECPRGSKNELESLINAKTSKVLSFFDLSSTLTYLVHEERPLAGKKLNENEVIVSRHRHVIFSFSPRIVTKWKIVDKGNSKILDRGDSFVVETKTRLSLFSTIVFVLLFLGSVVPAIKNLIQFQTLRVENFQTGIILFFFIGMCYYEIITLEGMFTKILKGDKIKSLYTV